MFKKTKVTSDGIKARGFFRLQINEDGKVVGDSGWKENTVVNLGFEQYLCASLGTAVETPKNIAYAMLGTGTAPAVTDTALNGEITDVAAARCAVTPTTIASKTVQFAFTLASNVYTAAKTIQNVGLINHSSTVTPGTIFSGNTYATSALAKLVALKSVMTYRKLLLINGKTLYKKIKTILSKQMNKIIVQLQRLSEEDSLSLNEYAIV